VVKIAFQVRPHQLVGLAKTERLLFDNMLSFFYIFTLDEDIGLEILDSGILRNGIGPGKGRNKAFRGVEIIATEDP